MSVTEAVRKAAGRRLDEGVDLIFEDVIAEVVDAVTPAELRKLAQEGAWHLITKEAERSHKKIVETFNEAIGKVCPDRDFPTLRMKSNEA
jgi:hypothetical protein